MMMGCPGQLAEQLLVAVGPRKISRVAAPCGRGSQGPRASGRVRRLDAVDSRVNGHKAIYKAKHLLLREEGDIYYLKKRKTERHKDKDRERERHVYTRQETDRRERLRWQPGGQKWVRVGVVSP